jgi:ABC-type uncharacterized transport system ATPase subunit
MKEPILRVRGLTRDFGGVRAVDLDLDVEERELRCLIGPNGAGKSTFLKILCGALKPSGGSVRFRGREIAGLDAFRIARLGVSIKFQVPSVFEQLTLLQNLHLAAEWRFGAADGLARARRQVGAIGLAERAGDAAATPSHGQKQRLEIAMATIGEPALILLDEPTAGMSPEEVDRCVDLVLGLARRATVIVVEHNMDFVRRIARRVTVMHEGRVFAEGTMAEIEADPRVRDIYLGRQIHACAAGR